MLEPDNVRGHCWIAILHVMRGSLDEARVHLARAREIDPLAPYPYAMSGWALLSAGRTAEAIPLIEQALAFDPDNSLALWTSGMALVKQGRAAEAIPRLERATTPPHRAGVLNGVRGWALASAGRIEEARAVLDSLRSRSAPSPTLPSEGWLLAALGDRESAFAILEKAADEGQALVAHVGLPPFDTLRSDPKFSALVTRMGLHRAADKASPPAPSSGGARADEGFWVAVLPFKSSGSNPALAALAEGLSEEIVTGLSRFSYLRVIARGSTSRFGSGATDIRTVGKEIGARYVMEGSLRQAGSRLRVAVQLTDAATGAHLWAEAYDRPFNADDVFALQDDLVPRIVSTVADQHGVLPHSMSGLIRNKSDERLTPIEAVLRVFSFHERMSPEEHRKVRALLERTVREHPDEGDGWAMLATLYADEYMFGFEGQPDPLARAQKTAQRAVEVAPTSWLAAQALAQSLFFRRELQAFRPVAERTIALNPMDSAALAFISLLLALSGAWERGLEVSEAARKLNPHFPGWYWLTPIFHAYHHRDYRAAIDAASRINMPGYFWGPASQAAAFGQLGEIESAGKALNELLLIRPDFAATARDEIGKYFDPELLEHFVDGLGKAGLEVKVVLGVSPEKAAKEWPAAANEAASRPSLKASDPKVAIAVLPFSDISPAKDQEYLCEGMAEEIMNALVRVDGIRVASRASAFRARREGHDVPSIARALSVGHILDGSVRVAGTRLRVTAQLTDAGTGYPPRRIHGGAVRAFREAVRLDPGHAPSWTGLAESLALSAHMSLIPAHEACVAARQALSTALELQGESASGLHGEAFVAFIERRWKAMEAAVRRAIEIEPSHVPSLGLLGMFFCLHQKPGEAEPFFERAREADPLASFPYMLTALGLLTARRPQEALRYAEQALTFEKEDASALFCSSLANVALGRYEEGIAAAEHGLAVSHRGADFLGLLGWALATAERHDEARALLEELRARPLAGPPIVSEGWLLGALGEKDAAFEVLARAESAQQLWLYYTGLPGFDTLRADPRFAELCERLGLRPGRTA